MIFTQHPTNSRTFYGVAMFLILIGAGTFSTGVVQTILETFFNWQFGWPLAKILGGLVILSLGYIVLELELMRQK
jgi:uncharacterized membrane protein HdeD (DUF308 family)